LLQTTANICIVSGYTDNADQELIGLETKLTKVAGACWTFR